MLGIYHHAPPADTGISSYEVADTWANQAIAFVSGNAAKMALWLRKIPPP